MEDNRNNKKGSRQFNTDTHRNKLRVTTKKDIAKI